MTDSNVTTDTSSRDGLNLSEEFRLGAISKLNIVSKERYYTKEEMHRCWIEAQDSLSKEYGLEDIEGIEEMEKESPIYNSFQDFIENGFRPGN